MCLHLTETKQLENKNIMKNFPIYTAQSVS
jgi:hypothetical protein